MRLYFLPLETTEWLTASAFDICVPGLSS